MLAADGQPGTYFSAAQALFQQETKLTLVKSYHSTSLWMSVLCAVGIRRVELNFKQYALSLHSKAHLYKNRFCTLFQKNWGDKHE